MRGPHVSPSAECADDDALPVNCAPIAQQDAVRTPSCLFGIPHSTGGDLMINAMLPVPF